MAITTAAAILGAGALAAGGAAVAGSRAASAAKSAASTQAASQQEAISQQQAQLEELRKLLRPYVEAGRPDLTQPYIGAGPGALQAMQGLAGLRGAGEQQAAIEQIKQGAQYQELARQGEEAILQNAAATGGLRGGNVQAALAQYRPALLNQLIESQYGKLAGLTSLGSTSAENLLRLGQASAAGVGAAGQQSAANIGNLLAGQGQASAAGIIGAAQARAQGLGSISGNIGSGVQNYLLYNAILGNQGLGGSGGAMPYAPAAPTAASPGTGQYGMVTSGLDVAY